MNKKMSSLNDDKGFSLVEIAVSMLIFIFVWFVTVLLIGESQKILFRDRYSNQATKLAIEGMERIKSETKDVSRYDEYLEKVKPPPATGGSANYYSPYSIEEFSVYKTSVTRVCRLWLSANTTSFINVDVTVKDKRDPKKFPTVVLQSAIARPYK